jgi:hypothetical protein
MGNERRRSENAKRIIAEQRQWAGDVSIAEEEVDEEEEDEEAWQRGHNFLAVGSVKPAIATLDLHVISVPKAKKKPKRKQKK